MIESTQNQWVKHVRRLQRERRYRKQQGQFVIEGTRWFSEAVAFPELITAVYHTPEWQASNPKLSQFVGISAPITAVSPTVMQAMSDTSSPAGIMATVQMPDHQLPPNFSKLLILDGIADPGNLGTIIRTAAAAGMDAVILAQGSVDLFNPKVVRSTMGALLHLPILEESWNIIAALVRAMPVYGLDAVSSAFYTDVDWKRPFVLLLGNEGHGLSNEGQAIINNSIAIPMNPPIESLNAAMAAGIVMFEAKRQRTS